MCVHHVHIEIAESTSMETVDKRRKIKINKESREIGDIGAMACNAYIYTYFSFTAEFPV